MNRHNPPARITTAHRLGGGYLSAAEILRAIDRMLEPDTLVCHPSRAGQVRAATAETPAPDLWRVITSEVVPPDVVMLIPARDEQGEPTPLPLGDPTTDPAWRRYAVQFAQVGL